MEKGDDYGIKPEGLGARDSLRLEAGLSLYGHELSDTISPIEASLSWLVSSNESYIAKDIILKQKQNGASREVIAFELSEKGIPRENYQIFSDNVNIGHITSGGFSPTFKKGIGFGLVKKSSVKVGDSIAIEIRNKMVKGEVVKRPFYKYNG